VYRQLELFFLFYILCHEFLCLGVKILVLEEDDMNQFVMTFGRNMGELEKSDRFF